MNGYMKLYLASETDEPIWQVAGDWVNTAKRTKYMSKARKYSISVIWMQFMYILQGVALCLAT